jgi:VanZ family protein
VLAQTGAIFAASSLTAVPDMPGGLTGYTGHMIGYALLGGLAFRGFAGATWSGLTRGAAVRALLLASAYGVTDEFHQRFVPHRTPDVHDWLADTAGALIGVLIVAALARLAGRRGDRTRGV